MEELSERQMSILKHIIKEIEDKGYPPSVREIGKAVGLKSPASVHNHLKTLEKLNYIRRDPSKPRAIEVLYNPNKKNVKQKDLQFNKEMLHIPLVGKVTAGQPILAEENIEDYFSLPADYLKSSGRDVFMLRVSGESMIDAGIHDNDFVIARKQQHADNGDIVIALIEDEATVKTFYKENDHIRLQPENETFEPIIVPDVSILGKVVGLYRNLT
ncbi:MAG: transcriptional repressor LexA [bacterium]